MTSMFTSAELFIFLFIPNFDDKKSVNTRPFVQTTTTLEFLPTGR